MTTVQRSFKHSLCHWNWPSNSAHSVSFNSSIVVFVVLSYCPSENVGEVINNTAILEHNTSSKSTCASFRNMVGTAVIRIYVYKHVYLYSCNVQHRQWFPFLDYYNTSDVYATLSLLFVLYWNPPFLQSIKKIKRADRKGSESVTEEKFALLFSTEISITGCDTPYKIQVGP